MLSQWGRRANTTGMTTVENMRGMRFTAPSYLSVVGLCHNEQCDWPVSSLQSLVNDNLLLDAVVSGEV